MTIYATGGEADGFTPIPGNSYVHSTTGATFEGTASRGSMKITQSTSELELPLSTNVTEVYIHMHLYQEVVAGTVDDWIQFKKLDDSAAFRCKLNADGTWSIQKYVGAAWSTLASSVSSVLSASGGNIDFYFKVHASSGEVKVFKDGTEIITYSGDTSIDNTSLGKVHWKGQTGAANELYVSQVICASERTVGWVLQTGAPDGAGANVQWTGAYTDIDEFILDTGDFIETDTLSQISTFTIANIDAAYSTYNVKAVAVATRASNDAGSALADIQGCLRVNSVNYFSANLALPKDGNDHSVQAIWETNPDTAGVWTQTEVNGTEAGVKAV